MSTATEESAVDATDQRSRNRGQGGVSTAESDGSPLADRAVKRHEQREKLRTSKFDAVSSLLMSLFWFIGVFTLLLFIVWWTSRLSFGPRPFPPIIENPAGRGENAEGFERDFEPPGADEIQDLTEPTIQDTIAAVTDAVSSVAASLDTVTTDSAASAAGSGKGDSRPPGPEGEGDDIIPRFERWQLNFAAKNLAAYAEQLDYYRIELGAIGGTIQGVDYAAKLSGTPIVRRGVSDDEKRLYFMWTTRSPLEQFDRQLLTKAGVPLAGRLLVKFIEPALENELANIELEYTKSKGYPGITSVAKTIFESQPTSGGFHFVVIDQRYRKGK